MSNKYKTAILLICVLALFLAAVLLHGNIKNRPLDAEEMAASIEAALNEVEPGWEMTAMTTDAPTTFTDGEGNTIIYHCLRTEYHDEVPPDDNALNVQAVSLIIDPESSSSESTYVGTREAILCKKSDRAYLCWTLSAEYSFVIEYTPTAVAVEDIYKMAESLYLP